MVPKGPIYLGMFIILFLDHLYLTLDLCIGRLKAYFLLSRQPSILHIKQMIQELLRYIYVSKIEVNEKALGNSIDIYLHPKGFFFTQHQ